MATDVLVSRELKSLQDEIAAAQQERRAAPTEPAAASSTPEGPPKESADERELQDHIRELASEVTGFFEDAEKSISAHPTKSVVSALLVGILIGRLLGRR